MVADKKMQTGSKLIRSQLERILPGLLLFFLLSISNVMGQDKIEWSDLPALPGETGWAGMYAGVSNNRLFCMGGANFPVAPPWEGGKKTWYDDIYMLEKGKQWIKIKEKLPVPLGYGTSVSYKQQLIIAGGNNADSYSDKVYSFQWNGKGLQTTAYPDLPVPLANMSGALLQNLFIIAGGSSAATGTALKKCYALDLENIQQGWFEFDPWPGPERLLPLVTAFDGKFYVFSGEKVGLSAAQVKFREILQDAYRLTPVKVNGKWCGSWEKLAPMPEGMSAGASPVPVLKSDHFFFWGGVNALTALNTDHNNEHALSKNTFLYDPATDTWKYLGAEQKSRSRVTLPTVHWNNEWAYISGEIRGGVRINTIVTIK
ncbi:hypothetical protein [Chitinophaga sp. MM2321]|uniref:hypothetical protein n=1 Tax=Chitinophaga sp. MM2321 TaxID=3137178 RepID=UPI0032D59577